jgi:PrtD family type I secretion system ABC transporter
MAKSAVASKARKEKNELQRVMLICRTSVRTIGVFSLVINLLMLAMPIYMLQVYDRVITTGHVETLISLTVMTTVAFLTLGLLDMLRTAIGVRTGCWLERTLAPVYLTSSVQAQLAGRSVGVQPIRDLAEIRGFIASPSLNILFDAPWVPIFVTLIWLLHPALGVLALVGAVLLLVLSLANEWLTRGPTRGSSLAALKATQQADAAIRNAEVVTAMGMLPAVIENWRKRYAEALSGAQKAGERAGMLIGIGKFVRFALQMGVLGLGAYLVLLSELSPGSMIAGSILLGRALAPVEMAMSAWRNLTSARLAYERLSQCLDENPIPPARMRLPPPHGKIAVEDLSFTEPTHRTIVLRRISFEVEPGEVLAMVGPSGAGKSTLCRFLVGVGQPTSGRVRIDGSDVRHWDPAHLGRFIGFLPQSVELFAGTVRENIARLDDHDHDAVVRAAMLAQAHEMIQRLPNGYDTEIGDGGARLSGGQRQRIGLARAVYGDPRVIVMDEPNANLDQAGEAALAVAIKTLKKRNIALVIVGHRPSTLFQADTVLLIKEGLVALHGPREEVLQRLQRVPAAGPPFPEGLDITNGSKAGPAATPPAGDDKKPAGDSKASEEALLS